MKAWLRSHYAPLVGVIWFAAIISLSGAAWAVADATRAWQNAQDSQAAQQLPVPSKIETPASPATYQALVRRLSSLHPDVRWLAQPDGMRLEVQNLQDYGVFRLALADVLSSLPGAQWRATELCAGAECQGPAYSAVLRATQASLLVKEGSM